MKRYKLQLGLVSISIHTKYYCNCISANIFDIINSVIGSVHRGTSREQIDRTFHLQSRWQLSSLRNSP